MGAHSDIISMSPNIKLWFYGAGRLKDVKAIGSVYILTDTERMTSFSLEE